MKVIFYPLMASKTLNYCSYHIEMMKRMESEELIELGFIVFVANTSRVLEYLRRESKLIDKKEFQWVKDKIKNLPHGFFFKKLRDIVAHHYIIPLTPIINIVDNVVNP